MHRTHAPLVLALLAAGCVGHSKLVDPTLVVRGSEGAELGVVTDYGIVFLGRSATAGELEITAWFGDGPSIERSSVEPVGGGLYTAETELRLPAVGFALEVPPPGTEVLVKGRRGWDEWTREVDIVRRPDVDGILLPVPSGFGDMGDQIGAGVYVQGPAKRLELLGLVSGKLRLEGPDGAREYLTVMGPDDLWRLIAHRRELPFRSRQLYREDVL